jgi:hypothetical protein
MIYNKNVVDWRRLTYPACVGIVRIGRYPNTVLEYWSDGVFREISWYLRLFPMRWLTWNRQGIKLKKLK